MEISLAKTKAKEFMNMVLGSGPELGGDAGAFAAIKNYPARAKCVLLPWRTFVSVLDQPLEGVSKNHAVVSTELQQ
jgi:NifU-like protein involved in Fe-S cluster formation